MVQFENSEDEECRGTYESSVNKNVTNGSSCDNRMFQEIRDTSIFGLDDERRSLTEIIAIGVTLTVIILITVFGNLLVCVTVLTNRRMHNVTNYFLVSLATSDLLLGCIVLPFSVVITLGSDWPLGAAFCNIYCASDVMLCTVSILTLFGISLDRYFAVTSPFRYVEI